MHVVPAWRNATHTMQQFANKHVLITGGSEGLGLALAKQLVAQNARVSLVARTLSKLEAAAQTVVEGTGCNRSQVSYHTADVSNYEQVWLMQAVTSVLHMLVAEPTAWHVGGMRAGGASSAISRSSAWRSGHADLLCWGS